MRPRFDGKVKNMVQDMFPNFQPWFPNFLHDSAEYAQAEEFWRGLWIEVTRLAGQEQEWQYPWLETAYADGTPFKDGDPIFSTFSPSRKLGIRVIQNQPQEVGPQLAIWSDVIGDEWSGEVRTLVISCVLSQRAAALARNLMLDWMLYGRVSLFQREEVVASLLPEDGLVQEHLHGQITAQEVEPISLRPEGCMAFSQFSQPSASCEVGQR